MAITTDSGLVSATASGQPVEITKTTAIGTIAFQPFSLLDVAGTPGSGTLAVGNVANGLVPTDATNGYPTINAFGGANLGHLGRVSWSNTVPCRLALYDRLFNSGSHSLATLGPFGLSAQPSYLTRSPTGDGLGCVIFLEINTAVAASAATVAITYTNEQGVTGRSTGASVSLASFTTRRLVPMPLQAGDRGV
ncbi:MAG: hypothetical protein ACRCSN_02605, partial [Dermatophilaceae bacterium]